MLALVLLAAGAAPASAQQRSAPPGDEREAVLAVVNRVFDGMRTKDTALLLSAFDSTARLVGIRPGRGGGTTIQAVTARQFAELVARDTRGVWNERLFDPEVRIDGTLASVWAPYDFHLGAEFSHCGVDAIHLLKTEAGWKIVGLADSFRREGCPRRPPAGR